MFDNFHVGLPTFTGRNIKTFEFARPSNFGLFDAAARQDLKAVLEIVRRLLRMHWALSNLQSNRSKISKNKAEKLTGLVGVVLGLWQNNAMNLNPHLELLGAS
jgi:hypothetical protein